MTVDPLERLRRNCLAFPEDAEQLGAALRLAAGGVQHELVTIEPHRFFRPPYVGGRGWLGVRLDVEVDWDEIAGICEEAYRVIAPKRLVALLDARP